MTLPGPVATPVVFDGKFVAVGRPLDQQRLLELLDRLDLVGLDG